MGADRRGPLAAFVIVALIAAILLVTSVRSQAAPWFSTRFVAGPATEPHLWRSVTGGVDQVVQQGTVLVRKAAHAPSDDATRIDAMGASNSVATSRHLQATSTAHHLARTRHYPSAHHRPANQPRHSTDHAVTHGQVDAPTMPPGHGRHLGWDRHHGQEQSVDSPDTGETSDLADSADHPEHGHGKGHANGHGHAYGQGHAYGHDRD